MSAKPAWLLFMLAACAEPSGPEQELQVLYHDTLYRQSELDALGLRINHFAMDPKESRPILLGFDSEQAALGYLRQGLEATTIEDPPSQPCTSYARFYSSYYWKGSHFSLRAGEGSSRLIDTAGPNWDNRINCLSNSWCSNLLTVYEDAGFQGRTLSIGTGMYIGSLSEKRLALLQGWSNNISSLRSIIYLAFSASDTDSARRNTKNTSVELFPSQVIQLGTCGLPGTFSTGDTVVRLYDPNGNEVAANDDSCDALSFLTYTVPPGGGGTYEIRAGCFGDGSCQGTLGYAFFWQSLADAAGTYVFQGE